MCSLAADYHPPSASVAISPSVDQKDTYLRLAFAIRSSEPSAIKRSVSQDVATGNDVHNSLGSCVCAAYVVRKMPRDPFESADRSAYGKITTLLELVQIAVMMPPLSSE